MELHARYSEHHREVRLFEPVCSTADGSHWITHSGRAGFAGRGRGSVGWRAPSRTGIWHGDWRDAAWRHHAVLRGALLRLEVIGFSMQAFVESGSLHFAVRQM